MNKKFIIKQLEIIFDGPGWYGPSLQETLDRINEGDISNAYKNSHSLIEILGHITAWRQFVIERLKGNETYDVSDEMNFPKSNNLKKSVADLKASQQTLLELINNFPEDRLKEKVSGRSYSFQTMLLGIAQHDLYHLGQISLLVK